MDSVSETAESLPHEKIATSNNEKKLNLIFEIIFIPTFYIF